ncbi:MAG: adenylosuccinate synthase [Spirochaetia bacterium]|nr:adenylosuccinate synthase [Spirochaetia bacterium]
MSAHLVVGTQWGDEGKAKVIDYLCENIDIIVRYQGGANAGHTVKVGNEEYIFHLIPSGILYQNTICVIGNGVVLDPVSFMEEMDSLKERGIDAFERTILSDSLHLVLPLHRVIDGHREGLAGSKKIGTTGRGIGICYADKMLRVGLRMGDLLDETVLKNRLEHILEFKNAELTRLYNLKEVELAPLYDDLLKFRDRVQGLIRNTSFYLNEELKNGKKVLLEGAQGTALDIDCGTYPFVTSSNTTTGGAITGSGMSFQHLKRVTGICKAYVTRVGEGPFPTELFGEEGERLRGYGREYGATTGRPRRTGWFDTELVKHSARINGLTDLALTKLDILSEYDEIPICTGYEIDGKKIDAFPAQNLEKIKPIYETLPGWKTDISKARSLDELPKNCRSYIDRLTELTGVPISLLSVGPGRDETIFLS